MAGIFSQFLKSVYESSAGRISWMSNMWAIVDSRWDKKRLVNKNLIGSSRVNERGEWKGENGVTLVKKICNPNCPSPPGDDFYQNEKNGLFWVPATECRKCEFHMKSDQNFRFPRCVFKRATTPKEVAQDTLKTFGDLTDQALEKTNQIMNGGS